MLDRAIWNATRAAFAAPSASPTCIKSASRCICARRRGSACSRERSTDPSPAQSPQTYRDFRPRLNARPWVVPRPPQIGHSTRSAALIRPITSTMNTIVCRPIVCKRLTMKRARCAATGRWSTRSSPSPRVGSISGGTCRSRGPSSQLRGQCRTRRTRCRNHRPPKTGLCAWRLFSGVLRAVSPTVPMRRSPPPEGRAGK